MNTKALEILKRFEGFRAKAYKDVAGVLTIGYGTTVYPDGTKVKAGDTITETEATVILQKTVDKFQNDVRRLLPATLPQDAVDAVTLLVYNIGVGAFSKSTLLKRIKENKNNFPIIEKEWNRWCYAGGKVVKGLQIRRGQEFQLYKSAVLNDYTKCECYDMGRASR